MGLWSSSSDVRLYARGCNNAGETIGRKLRCKLSAVTQLLADTPRHSATGTQEFLTVETPELTCACQCA